MEQPANTSKNEAGNHSLLIYKSKEKLISESLYRNLHVLCRFSEPTAEFLRVSTPSMFIKSNPRAFIVVMHFIFNCVDAEEVHKRFIWPIFDKAGETKFRKTALDYMNHLNVIHQLGLETLKLSNIHIPGGLKFIKIVHKFTYLAMKLEVNKPEHGSLPNVQNIPDGDDMLDKLEQYVERGMDYAARIQIQSQKLWERIDKMQSMMKSSLTATAESKKGEICWTCYQKKWKDHLDCVVRDIAPQLEIVNLLSKSTVQLNQLLLKLFMEKRENIVEFDRVQLIVVQKCLKKIHPDFEQEINGIVDGSFINFASLLKVFSLLLPNIMIKLVTFTEKNIEAIQYEFNEIDACDAIATKYQEATNEYKDLIQPFNEKQLKNFLQFCQETFNLPFNVMGTPVVTRRDPLHRIGNRILIDDSTNKSRLFNEPSALLKAPKTTSSSSSLSGCKPHEAAMQLLAKPKSRSNMSMSSMPNMSSLHHPFSTPKLSSTMASIRLNPRSEFKLSPNFPMTPTRAFGENFREASGKPNGIAVRKVKTSSLTQPYIESPSRRFRVNEIPSEFTAMMQTNVNLDEIINVPRMDHVDNVENGRHLQTLNGNGENLSAGMSCDAGFQVATSTSSSRQTNEFGVELIENISDSVLNDILSD